MTQPERTDEELLDSAREGDEEAFGAFVRRHTATVHRWMARAVGEDDADDMTQDVFLKAYRGLPRFRGEDLFARDRAHGFEHDYAPDPYRR